MYNVDLNYKKVSTVQGDVHSIISTNKTFIRVHFKIFF